MRLLFFVGLPRAPLRMVLTALHPATLVSADVGGVQYVRSPYGVSVWRRVVRSISVGVPASEAPSGAWSVWCVATPGDQEQAQRIFRWLARYRIDESDRVLGPYDCAKFKALAASRTDDDGNALADLFMDGMPPWVVMGDSASACMAEAYNPADEEAAED